ncbi:MAG: lysostaphin resistance A-like protein [Promethearchaeota archaeon]
MNPEENPTQKSNHPPQANKKTFSCAICEKEMNFADHPKFCINCGQSLVIDVHGEVLVDASGRSYVKPNIDANFNPPYNNQNQFQGNYQTPTGAPYVNVPQNMYYGQKKWKKKRTWNVVAGIFLPLLTYIGIIILTLVIMVVIMLITGDLALNGTIELLVSSFTLIFFIVPFFWIQRYYTKKLTWKEKLVELGLDFDKYPGKSMAREIILGIFLGLLGVLIVFGLQYIGAVLVEWIFRIDVNVLYESEEMSRFALGSPQSLGELLLFVFTMVAFVGVPEEVMFRGFVQRSFEKKLSKNAALLLTAGYFAIYHVYIFIVVPPIFFFLSISYLGLSIYMGFIRNWRKDIIAVSIMHMIYNSTQMIIIFIIFS